RRPSRNKSVDRQRSRADQRQIGSKGESDGVTVVLDVDEDLASLSFQGVRRIPIDPGAADLEKAIGPEIRVELRRFIIAPQRDSGSDRLGLQAVREFF